MTPSMCSINIDIVRAGQWAQGCKCQEVSDICCSYFLIDMDSVIRPSHKLGGLCPYFEKGDHMSFTESEPESVRKRGRSKWEPRILDSHHYIIHFYSERNGVSYAVGTASS